jgi:hypothetical protein
VPRACACTSTFDRFSPTFEVELESVFFKATMSSLLAPWQMTAAPRCFRHAHSNSNHGDSTNSTFSDLDPPVKSIGQWKPSTINDIITSEITQHDYINV